MAASRLIILGVAVAAAGGAGYVAKFMTRPSTPAVVQAPAKPQIALSEVLVLTEDVPMGAGLAEKISWQNWPSDTVNESFITREAEPDALEKAKDAIARVPLFAGEPVRRSKLIGGGRPFLSSVLPSGYRAVATTISADTAAGGFILPNDRVDVIMVRRVEGASATGGLTTETVLENVRVLAIDQTIQEDEEGKKVKVGQTATLELTPEQVKIISVAQQMADRLVLALRAVVDTNEQTTQQADYLVSGRGRGSIRLIKSGEISEVGARK